MKTIVNILPVRWIFRFAVAALASYVTGLNILWCFLAYIGVMFLIRISLNMFLVLVGCALMVAVFMALLLGIIIL